MRERTERGSMTDVIWLLDAVNVVLSVVNIVFIVFFSVTFVRESKTTHANYTVIRSSWIFSCFQISASTLFQCSRRLGDGLAPDGKPLHVSNYPRSWMAVCYSASVQIRCVLILFSVERAVATFYSQDYETNKKYYLIGPALVFASWMVAPPLGYVQAYAHANHRLIAGLLLALDGMGLAAMFTIKNLNRRLQKVIHQRLSQRYQIYENIRVLQKVAAMSLFELFFQGAVLVFMVFCFVFPDVLRPNGPMSNCTILLILNGYATISFMTLLYFLLRKHRSVRRLVAAFLYGAGDRRALGDDAPPLFLRANKKLAAEEHKQHFASLRTAWSKAAPPAK